MRRKILLLAALLLPLAPAAIASDPPALNPMLESSGQAELPAAYPGTEPHAPMQPFSTQARPQPSGGSANRRPLSGSRPIALGGNAGQGSGAAGLAHLMTAGDLIGFSRDLGDGVQAITIINASQRWMAVYHIDSGGQIRLTSSRPLDADFTIQFNASSPLPEEIRRLQGK